MPLAASLNLIAASLEPYARRLATRLPPEPQLEGKNAVIDSLLPVHAK